MERLEFKYNATVKALVSLEESLKEYKVALELEEIKKQKIYRDSVIQRFEYSVDTLWKYAKEYLAQECGVVANTPKKVFKECGRAGFITEKEIVGLLEMVDHRNLSSHMYHEVKIEEIAVVVPEYYTLMTVVIEKLKPVKQIFVK